MEWSLAIVVGTLFACGVLALLKGTALHLLVGVVLLSQAVNLSVFVASGLVEGHPPLVGEGAPHPETADPLPQALVLTAIVIGLGVLAFTLALVVRAIPSLPPDELQSIDDSER